MDEDGINPAAMRLLPDPERMSVIKRLDLGGTACFDSIDAISISLDGSLSDGDESMTYNYVGDYTAMPNMPSDHFEHAHGSCFLEGSDGAGKGDDGEDYHQAYRELYRVLKPGGTAWLMACGGFHVNHIQHALNVGFIIDEPAMLMPEINIYSSGRPEVELTYCECWKLHKPQNDEHVIKPLYVTIECGIARPLFVALDGFSDLPREQQDEIVYKYLA